MNEQMEAQEDLVGRLDLVERMIQEGRKSTEYWGWSQVLWGGTYLVAIGWSHTAFGMHWAWPITMIVAAIVMVAVIRRKKRGKPVTTTGRTMRGVWTAVGIALFLFCFSAGISGHAEPHTFVAAVETLLGVAYFSGAMVLHWHTQFWVAGTWWAAAVATCFSPVEWIIPILVAATLIGMIGFGLYLMVREHRDRQRSLGHA